MSSLIKAFLRRHSLEWHLCLALMLGLFARLLSAYFVYGPQALDDYKHGVWPAYQYFANLPLDLPEYRSHLLTWVLAGFVEVGSRLGVSSALGQVRVMYAGLSILSLIGIWGCYIYVSTFRSRTFGGLALYLMALYPLMPFVSTRAFGESVALSFVVAGMSLMERARNKEDAFTMACGFFVLGIAVLFRFQVGLMSLSYIAYLIFKRQWRLVMAAGVAGIALVLLQAVIDLASHKEAFQTLRAYLEENSGGAAKYGSSPWYSTWALVLGLTLFPVSLVFYPYTKILLRRHFPVFLVTFVFVAVHSWIPHKEERFMYPVVGLILIELAAVWALARNNSWVKKIYQPIFLFVGAVGLAVACFINTQAGEIEVGAVAQEKFGTVGYLDYNSLFGESLTQFYFLRPQSLLVKVTESELSLTRAASILSENKTLNGVAILTSEPQAFARIQSLNASSSGEVSCGETRVASSMVDRLLYSLNPRHNQRRRPTVYILCERK